MADELHMDAYTATDQKELGLIHEKINGQQKETGEKPEFSAAVGMSREWDARKAGREVAEETLKGLNGKKPNFFLVFTTIHYERCGGFKEFLAGIWEILPEGTPLVGGTVGGFINPQGCYTRGATALAVSYPNMDISIGVGHNTKRTPNIAAKECANTIKKELSNSKYTKKFLLTLISGTKVMEIPGLGQKNVIHFKPLASFVKIGLSLSTLLFQKGPGREEELLKELVKDFPDYSISHLSTTDDLHLLRDYQFMGHNVYTNTVLGLGICTDLDFVVNFTHGGKPIKEIELTKQAGNKRLSENINNRPAASEFTKILELPKNFFFESDAWEQRFPYFPIGFKQGERVLPRAIVMVLNESLFTKTRIDSNKAFILFMSGERMHSAVKELLSLEEYTEIQPKFGLGISCGIRLTAIGDKIYDTRDLLLDYFRESPFLLVYTAGEGVCTPKSGLCVLEESININSFGLIKK